MLIQAEQKKRQGQTDAADTLNVIMHPGFHSEWSALALSPTLPKRWADSLMFDTKVSLRDRFKTIIKSEKLRIEEGRPFPQSFHLNKGRRQRSPESPGIHRKEDSYTANKRRRVEHSSSELAESMDGLFSSDG